MAENFKRSRPYKKRWARQDFYLKGCASGVKVPDSSQAALEKSLKYLKRQMKDSDVINQVKAKREFVKPSVARRRAKEVGSRKQWVYDQTCKRFWDEHCWIAPVPKNYGPNPSDLCD